MKFYEFGTPDKPVIVLLPGTCCHWKVNFREVIPLLERSFFVVCVSYDGFDETERSVFPDILTETEKIERYINERFGGKIYAAYGCSMQRFLNIHYDKSDRRDGYYRRTPCFADKTG